MKHYSNDNNKPKSASKQSTGGRHFASADSKPRYGTTGSSSAEKKPRFASAAAEKKPAAAPHQPRYGTAAKKHVAPTTAKPAAPAVRKPVAPTTAKPAAPAVKKPVAPTTAKPAAPAVRKPVAPTTTKPAAPAVRKPVAPATAKPAAPVAKKPVAPATAKPAAPAVKKPVAPTTAKPAAPVAQTPAATPEKKSRLAAAEAKKREKKQRPSVARREKLAAAPKKEKRAAAPKKEKRVAAPKKEKQPRTGTSQGKLKTLIERLKPYYVYTDKTEVPSRHTTNGAAAQQTERKRPHTDVPATPTAPVPKMKAGYAPAFLFGGFLLLMVVWFIVAPKATYSASEKRVLADFPETSAESIFSGKFGSGFETYFADHFPDRNLWVGINAYATLRSGNNGFTTTPSDEKSGVSGVYKCKDDYLINTPVSHDNRIDQNADLLVDFKKEIGNVPMTAMFVPSTGYIVDDKLPAIHDFYYDDEYFNNVAAKFQADNIYFIDLRQTFLNTYQSGTQLYYRTDHHWTTEGAYTAYREYCRLYGLTTAPKESFDIEPHPGFYGTTYSKSGYWFTPADTLEVWEKRADRDEDNIHIEISDGPEVSKEQDSLFFYEHDKEDDKYPIFIDGNHAKTVITNKNSKGGTVVVIKDSFAHCFAPFLADNFSKVILLDMRYSTENIVELVKEEKPQQVLVLYGIDNFANDTDLGHLWG